MTLDHLLLWIVCAALVGLAGVLLVAFLRAYDDSRQLRCREQIIADYRRQCAASALDLGAGDQP